MFSHSDFMDHAPMVSPDLFEQCKQLLQTMAKQLDQAVVVSDRHCSTAQRQAVSDIDQFVILVSPTFSAMLLGQQDGTRDVDPDPRLKASFSFEPEAIAAVLKRLAMAAPLDDRKAIAASQLLALIATIQPNSAAVQGHFTTQILALMSQGISVPNVLLCDLRQHNLGADSPSAIEVSALYPAVCQPVEVALRQQVEQERLLNQVISQIRQSLELPVILETAVSQVRQFLAVDRLIIYQFDSLDQSAHLAKLGQVIDQQPDAAATTSHYISFGSYVTYEARSQDDIPSLRHLINDYCSAQIPYLRDRYQQGIPLAVDDIEQTYGQEPEMLAFLQEAQVKSKLAAPIVVHDQFWGLLVAHQCQYQRRWQTSEVTFLQQIAEHLAIAIGQAQLYAQLQQQKDLLEQGVIERTRDLRDAMLAAQTANQAKSEFLSAMSHELRTPLTSIIGMSTTLQRWLADELTPRQCKHLQTIHDSGQHLLELINDILDLSQLEAGHLVLKCGPCSLSNITQQSMRIVEEQARLKQIDLTLDMRLNPSTEIITADPLRLQQVLLNLLSNAIKFTAEGGQVILSVFRDERIATFQVKDTGIGIAEDQQPLLFQKFQQLDTSYNRHYSGTGLGLALTKNLVELHGGSITVESTLGVGSIFTVRLPVQRSSNLRLATPSIPASPRALRARHNLGPMVLIENHEESANLVCDMLTAAGYQVVWIVEGSRAVEQIEILRPNAVILNVDVPDTNGYDLIRQLRQNPSTKQLKLVAMGQLSEAEGIQTCVAIGADDYLPKPLHPNQVLQKITALMAIKTA
ncbi:MAG: hybrid sensor histidine kinase/response regulator [Leptolyngbya sp. DLM2.Bin15]|nr:MAG: hybrid sensor histidine kinase/response regulator [Leptolyngbya sp. DLM2.Bin15]